MVFVCAAVAFLALPALTTAKPAPEVRPGNFHLEIRLPEKRGYSMEIEAFDHRHVYLKASKGAQAISYRVRGRVSSRRVEADFGSLGRIEIRMNLKAKPMFPWLRRGKRCVGKSSVELNGRFHGTVEFEGEPNVSGVSVRSGRATVERSFRRVCEPRSTKPKSKKREKRPEPELELGLLTASAHSGGRTTSFVAAGIGVESEVLFGVVAGSVHERLDRVRIARSAIEFIEGPALWFDGEGRRVKSARVKPPKPFTGKAFYRKETGSPASWTGDLAIRLTGTGSVPLAGPGFEADLCQSTSLPGFERCALRAQSLSLQGGAGALARNLYGSGSHSQPLALARLSSLR